MTRTTHLAALTLAAALLASPTLARPAPPLRLQAGIAAVGGGAACDDPATTVCPGWHELAAIPAVLSAQVDLAWSPSLVITPGLAWSFAPWRSGVASLLIPSLDLGLVRRDPARQVRFTAGLEAPVDGEGQVGLGGRIGLGATLLEGPWPGLAFDVGAGVSEVSGRASLSLRLSIGAQFGG